MKKLIVVTLSLLLIPAAVIFAQDLSTIEQYMIKLRNDNMGNTGTGEDKSVDGTPYMTPQFVKGEITLKTGKVFPGEYRFDIFSNQIEFCRNDQIMRFSDPGLISKVVIGDHILKYFSYKEDNDVKQAYFIVLEEGHYTLLEQKSKLFFAKTPAKAYQEASPARYVDGKDFFWLKVGDSPAEKILKQKDIISISGEHGTLAKQFIDKEKLKFKERSDYIRLAEYLNGAIR